jgi:hypothetical protein
LKLPQIISARAIKVRFLNSIKRISLPARPAADAAGRALPLCVGDSAGDETGQPPTAPVALPAEPLRHTNRFGPGPPPPRRDGASAQATNSSPRQRGDYRNHPFRENGPAAFSLTASPSTQAQLQDHWSALDRQILDPSQ